MSNFEVNHLLHLAWAEARESKDERQGIIFALLHGKLGTVSLRAARVIDDRRAVLAKAASVCAECKEKGDWRGGVNFDHQMRCKNGHVWEPDRIIDCEYNKRYDSDLLPSDENP